MWQNKKQIFWSKFRGHLVTLKVVMLPHLLPPMLSADWMSNYTRVGRGRRVAKQLIVCSRDQKKNGRNRSINKATKNRQSSATVKRRAGAKGLMDSGFGHSILNSYQYVSMQVTQLAMAPTHWEFSIWKILWNWKCSSCCWQYRGSSQHRAKALFDIYLIWFGYIARLYRSPIQGPAAREVETGFSQRDRFWSDQWAAAQLHGEVDFNQAS